MMHTAYSGATRQAILRALGTDALVKAAAERPPGSPFDSANPTPLGTLTGYRYLAKNPQATLMLGLPGELAGDADSEWFMDLTEGLPVTVQENDALTFENGDRRRVSLVRGSGGFTGRDAYRLYKLEAV